MTKYSRCEFARSERVFPSEIETYNSHAPTSLRWQDGHLIFFRLSGKLLAVNMRKIREAVSVAPKGNGVNHLSYDSKLSTLQSQNGEMARWASYFFRLSGKLLAVNMRKIREAVTVAPKGNGVDHLSYDSKLSTLQSQVSLEEHKFFKWRCRNGLICIKEGAQVNVSSPTSLGTKSMEKSQEPEKGIFAGS
nr:hypothetical protein [Tanacetum cinerariifolium]